METVFMSWDVMKRRCACMISPQKRIRYQLRLGVEREQHCCSWGTRKRPCKLTITLSRSVQMSLIYGIHGRTYYMSYAAMMKKCIAMNRRWHTIRTMPLPGVEGG